VQLCSPTRSSPGWDIVNNPLDLSTSKRSRLFRQLQRRQRDFIDDLRGNNTEPIQQALDDVEPW